MNKPYRKLSREIMTLTGFSGLLAALLFQLLSVAARAFAESYVFDHDLLLTEFDWLEVESWIFGGSLLISVSFFVILFLSLLGDRLSYIRRITDGIAALGRHEDHVIPLKGRNDLTELASAVNDLSEARRRLQEQEAALAREKEQLIRTLSHDIRTPLTSILAYSDYLASKDAITPAEQAEYLSLVRKKAGQIRDLTDVLLEGGRRNPEWFEEGKLLFTQLAMEFEADLEDLFSLQTDFSRCAPFRGSFDLGELRRIFDNLGSNVRKYADPAHPVLLSVETTADTVRLLQSNHPLPRQEHPDSFRLGIRSIRRIAQSSGGSVTVTDTPDLFSLEITLKIN